MVQGNAIRACATYSCKKEKDKSVAVTEVRLDKKATTLFEGDTEEQKNITLERIEDHIMKQLYFLL